LLLQWLKQTYLAVRLAKNPLFYKVKRNASIDNHLKELSLTIVNELAEKGLVSFNTETTELQPRRMGVIACRCYLKIPTIILLSEVNSGDIASEKQLLELIQQASEFGIGGKNLARYRQGDKKHLKNINKSIRYKIKPKEKGKAVFDDGPPGGKRCNVLLQAALHEEPLLKTDASTWTLRSDSNTLVQDSNRVLSALVTYLWESDDEEKLQCVLLVDPASLRRSDSCLFLRAGTRSSSSRPC